MEQKIGRITHYYDRLGVAAVEIQSGCLHKGDVIHIHGHTTDLEETVNSIELDHRQIEEASEGQNVGIKVVDKVREHDDVYKAYI